MGDVETNKKNTDTAQKKIPSPMWVEALTIGLPVLTGVIGIAVSVYGLVRARRDALVSRWARLLDVAGVAIRQSEAQVVRPILRHRMIEALHLSLARRHEYPDALHYRIHLLAALEGHIGLQREEKERAFDTALQFLVALLRTMPKPPLEVPTDADVDVHRGELIHVIEVAYNLRPRATAERVRIIGEFCHNITSDPPPSASPSPSPSPAGCARRSPPRDHHRPCDPPPLPALAPPLCVSPTSSPTTPLRFY